MKVIVRKILWNC